MNHHRHRLPLEEFYLNEYLHPIEYWLFLVKVLQPDKLDYLPFLDLEFQALKQFDCLLHGYSFLTNRRNLKIGKVFVIHDSRSAIFR